MRVVGGALKGRGLTAPKGANTRPTSDRVRESLFNLLAHGSAAVDLEGCRVIDLFAGTGALGVEALSRGADFALFVEYDPDARGAIRQNIENLRLTGRTRVFRRDALKLGEAGTVGQFDLAFLDPPYGKGLGEKALAQLAAGGWLASDALCVLEERADSEIAAPDSYQLLDHRVYGDTALYFLQFSTC